MQRKFEKQREEKNLKTEAEIEGATSQRMAAGTQSCKRQISPSSLQRWYSPDDSLILAQWCLLWSSDLENCKTIHFYGFKTPTCGNLFQQPLESKTYISLCSDNFSRNHFNIAGASDTFIKPWRGTVLWVKFQ